MSSTLLAGRHGPCQPVFKTCLPRGSVRVRTPPCGRQGRCSAGQQGQCWPANRVDVVFAHALTQYLVKPQTVLLFCSSAAWRQMVPICMEWWCTEANEATQTHCYNPVVPAYPVWAYYAHGRQRRCQEDPVGLLSGKLEKTTRSSPRGSALSNRIWNNTTSRFPKQQIWLRTALCGGWCRRMVLHSLRVTCQKRRQRCRLYCNEGIILLSCPMVSPFVCPPVPSVFLSLCRKTEWTSMKYARGNDYRDTLNDYILGETVAGTRQRDMTGWLSNHHGLSS